MTTKQQFRPVPRQLSRLVLLGCAAVVIALLVGGTVTAGRPDAGRQPAAARALGAVAAQPVAPATSQVRAASTVPPAPGELALQLQSLLGQHTVLAADMMRGRLREDPDLAQAANSALGKNTDAMAALIASAFGEQAAAQFRPLWSSHVTALFNYARGLADGDEAVQNQARVAITRAESDLAAFFVTAAQGRLPRNAAVSAVTAHVEHLVGQADAYAAEDWRRSEQVYREGFSHAIGLGKALAGPLLAPTAAKVLDTPSWRLRSTLGQLLGEHVVLLVAAMRAGVTDSPDFTAAGAAVNANTADLAGAVDTLFGPAAARQFQSLWADHVDLLVGYAAAVAKGDDAQRAAVGAGLARFERQLAAFLSTATGDRVAAAALAKALQSHDTMLRSQVDSFVEKDYGKAHELAYSTYQEMYGLARQLAQAFGVTVASRMPTGAADTGRGGMAGVVGGR